MARIIPLSNTGVNFSHDHVQHGVPGAYEGLTPQNPQQALALVQAGILAAKEVGLPVANALVKGGFHYFGPDGDREAQAMRKLAADRMLTEQQTQDPAAGPEYVPPLSAEEPGVGVGGQLPKIAEGDWMRHGRTPLPAAIFQRRSDTAQQRLEENTPAYAERLHDMTGGHGSPSIPTTKFVPYQSRLGGVQTGGAHLMTPSALAELKARATAGDASAEELDMLREQLKGDSEHADIERILADRAARKEAAGHLLRPEYQQGVGLHSGGWQDRENVRDMESPVARAIREKHEAEDAAAKQAGVPMPAATQLSTRPAGDSTEQARVQQLAKVREALQLKVARGGQQGKKAQTQLDALAKKFPAPEDDRQGPLGDGAPSANDPTSYAPGNLKGRDRADWQKWSKGQPPMGQPAVISAGSPAASAPAQTTAQAPTSDKLAATPRETLELLVRRLQDSPDPRHANAVKLAQEELARRNQEQTRQPHTQLPMDEGPYSHEELKRMMVKAAMLNDYAGANHILDLQAKSHGIGVHPESLEDLLTGAHHGRALDELRALAPKPKAESSGIQIFNEAKGREALGRGEASEARAAAEPAIVDQHQQRADAGTVGAAAHGYTAITGPDQKVQDLRELARHHRELEKAARYRAQHPSSPRPRQGDPDLPRKEQTQAERDAAARQQQNDLEEKREAAAAKRAEDAADALELREARKHGAPGKEPDDVMNPQEHKDWAKAKRDYESAQGVIKAHQEKRAPSAANPAPLPTETPAQRNARILRGGNP